MVRWVERIAWDLQRLGSPAVRRGWRLHSYLEDEARRARVLFQFYATPKGRDYAAYGSRDTGLGTRRLIERLFYDVHIACREARVRPARIEWALKALRRELEDRCA